MVWAPTKANREAIRFWLDCLQIVTIVAGVLAVGGTFYSNSRAEQTRLADQAQRETEQLAAIKQELERPYQEKKLALYLDAARVLAHLAASPNVEKESTEARFWELYWGELAFVESRTKDETKGGPAPSVEWLMVQFCFEYFINDPGRCTRSHDRPAEAAAFNMARQASQEVRNQWEKIGQFNNGTAQEAKAMLEKAVAAVKEDKAKALYMFNRGEGGFKDRDLYVWCANASDGIVTVQPYIMNKGKQLRDIEGKMGAPFDQEVMQNATEGTIKEVTYWWPRPGSDKPLEKTTFYTKAGDQICGVGYYKD